MLDRRLALAALPLAAFACFSSDDNGAPGNDAGYVYPDAGPFDGSIPDALSPYSDALPPTDSPADTADAAPLPVSVTVLGPAGPEEGIAIIFDDATGAVLTTGSTNSAGTFAAVVPSGSQVTALLGSPAAPQIVTVVGVEPGDALTARDAPSGADVLVTVPSLPDNEPPSSTGYFAIPFQCFGYEFSVASPVSVAPECTNGTTLPFALIANDENGDPTGFTYQTAIPIDVDAGTATASALSPWSTTFGTETITLANASTVTNYPSAYVSEIVGGVASYTLDYFDEGTDASTPSLSFTTHPGFADFVQSEIDSVTDTNQGTASISTIATRSAPPSPTATTTFDYSTLLPLITDVELDTTNVARPVVTITAGGSLASTAGTLVSIGWQSQDDAGAYFTGTWLVVAPPGTTTVTPPALPSSASAWLPSADASFSQTTAAAVAGDILPSYAAVRQLAPSLDTSTLAAGSYSNGPLVPPLPSAGTVSLTAYVQIPQ